MSYQNPNQTIPMRLNHFHHHHYQQQQHRHSAQNSASDVPDSPSAASTVSYFSDIGGDPLDQRYISRKTVESILSLQRHSHVKSGSVAGSRNSSSSMESFDIRNGALVFNRPLKATNGDPKRPFVCTLQRHDSGHSSPGFDVNGPSSTGEAQYFTFATNDTPPRRPMSAAANTAMHRGHPPSPRLSSDQGYDSFSLSSNDSYPSVNSSTSSSAKISAQCPQNRLKQIPEDVQLMELINTSTMLDCDKLCSTADVLLLKSHEKEREGDLRAAAALSDSAAFKARSAMEAPYSNHQTLITAKMKHSMCVMRSASLHKRLNDIEAEDRRRMKEQQINAQQVIPSGHHSRQNSRDSTHSAKHSRQGSKDSKEMLKDKDMSSSVGRHATLEYRDKSSSRSTASDNNNNHSSMSSIGKTLELYATLPKKGSKKKALFQQSLHSLGSLRVKSDDSNLYRDSKSINPTIESMAKTNKSSSDNNKKKLVPNMTHKNSKNSVNTTANTNTSKSVAKPLRSDSLLSRQSSAREEDFSDYYSEWEATRRSQQPSTASTGTPSEHCLQPRESTSGSASCRENDSEYYGEINGSSSAKKQHRVRRKLLMGGLIKRGKNRSLPDLRDGTKTNGSSIECPTDDSMYCEVVLSPNTNESQTKRLPPNNNKLVNNVHKNTSVNGPPKPTNANTAIQSPTATAQIHSAKGFHQSHRAFAAQNGHYQRPSLLKVSPPLVTEQIYENTQTIYQNTVTAKQQLINRNSNTNNMQNAKPMHTTNHNMINSKSVSNQLSSPTMLAMAATTRPPTPPKAKPNASNTVITVAEVHTYSTPSPVDSNRMSSKTETKNSFLKELTSKRAEIMKSSAKNSNIYGPDTSVRPNQPISIAQTPLPPLPPTSTTAAVVPKSALKSSLAKQHNNTMNDNNYETINYKPTTPTTTATHSTHPNHHCSQPSIISNQMPNSIINNHNNNHNNQCISSQQYTTSTSLPTNGFDETDSAAAVIDNQKSVRDLTSKFENIMTTKDIINSNGDSNLTGSTECIVDSNESSSSLRNQRMDPLPNGVHRSVTPMTNGVTKGVGVDDCSTKPSIPALDLHKFTYNSHNNYQIPSPTSPLNSPINGCLTAPGGVRPNRPPDYQTALKRIGMLCKGQVMNGGLQQLPSPAQAPQTQRSFYMNASGNIVQSNCGPTRPSPPAVSMAGGTVLPPPAPVPTSQSQSYQHLPLPPPPSPTQLNDLNNKLTAQSSDAPQNTNQTNTTINNNNNNLQTNHNSLTTNSNQTNNKTVTTTTTTTTTTASSTPTAVTQQTEPSVRPKVRPVIPFKKSVSFSDQVTLVACEQEEFMPNPILDKILAKNNMTFAELPQSP